MLACVNYVGEFVGVSCIASISVFGLTAAKLCSIESRRAPKTKECSICAQYFTSILYFSHASFYSSDGQVAQTATYFKQHVLQVCVVYVRWLVHFVTNYCAKKN